ncbi:YbaK/EbsC family protein [Teredinibacter sp. KSP-S5-2]|uniref:aminoacyl-tRNA deacylase n=1 Tax=Teredinibacter sp. KSP-S5-2 TaxID=3034506 RepID=UPI002935309D|nr:YbaK/EbsC family protein [Teredinibacter sp. KSP-S5-2]WNO10137.1 YbaK/EbsC family protein [Teredinibacter sp. KSP-S5-2]
MTISKRVSDYLDANNIQYDTLDHYYTHSAYASALAAHIPAKTIVKAVIFEDHEGHHLMAILPADAKVSVSKLEESLSKGLHLVDEEHIYAMFNDCEPGAIPAIGQAYNMNIVCEQDLDKLNDVYIEAGDHETLLHLSQEAFQKLMKNIKHIHFSQRTYH